MTMLSAYQNGGIFLIPEEDRLKVTRINYAAVRALKRVWNAKLRERYRGSFMYREDFMATVAAVGRRFGLSPAHLEIMVYAYADDEVENRQSGSRRMQRSAEIMKRLIEQ